MRVLAGGGLPKLMHRPAAYCDRGTGSRWPKAIKRICDKIFLPRIDIRRLAQSLLCVADQFWRIWSFHPRYIYASFLLSEITGFSWEKGYVAAFGSDSDSTDTLNMIHPGSTMILAAILATKTLR